MGLALSGVDDTNPQGTGLWLLDQMGRIQTRGAAPAFADASIIPCVRPSPYLAMAAMPSGSPAGEGVVALTKDGQFRAFGFFDFKTLQFVLERTSPLPTRRLPYAAMAITPDGMGASDDLFKTGARSYNRPAMTRLLAALVLTCVVALQAQSPATPVFPGASWDYVAPRDLAAYGWSQDALRKTSEYIRDESNTTGLVVVDRGRIVYRYGDIEELSYVASVRKSILAMLYGSWVENGTIKLDTTLEQLNIDDIGGLLPIEKRATIHHVITARSGVYHPASYSGDDLAQAPPRGSQQPGAYMLYSNWDFNVAGFIFEQLTKRNIYDELQAQLAIPLEFEDWDRSVQQKAGDLTISKYPAYPIWVSTRDMARMGYLMLREGNWQGRQVVSKDWARKIVSVVTPVHEMNPTRRRDGYYGYGYMWWSWDGPKAVGPFTGAYSANGAVGQWIAVFPAIDLVVAHKTHNIYGRSTSSASWQRIVELLFDAKGVTMSQPYPWAARPAQAP